jgi:hypothetical protein
MKTGLKLTACTLVVAAYIALMVLWPYSDIAFLPGLLVCNFLASLVHELRHLAAYGLLKLKWQRMVVSFFVFEAGTGCRFDGSRGIFEASCTCAYDSRIPLRRYDLALLSGGIAGILLGIGAGSLSFAATGGAAAFLEHLALVNLVHGAVNLLLPFSADRVLMRQLREASQENS